MLLTDRRILAAKPGEKLSEQAPRGAGRLIFRPRTKGRGEFFYRTRAGGRDRMTKIGNYPDDLSLAEARKRVGVLSSDPTAATAEGTLGDVLKLYVDHLTDSGKVSARGAEKMFLRAIPAGDALRLKRASQIRPTDITAIIARRIRDGATVEANRLRAILSAAFAVAAKTDHDPKRAAESEVRFALSGNPVTVVARVEEFEVRRTRVLSWEELGAYWRALESEPLPVKVALRFALASGGQRLQQVLRATWDDINDNVIRLVDTKGRGGKPRAHAVPITTLAEAQLELGRKAKHLVPFATHQFALSDAISRASKTLGGETFDARDLRRSVETRLADLGVSRETLGHLLSHGRTGVQEKHYDRAERLEEKAAALTLWTHHLEAAIENRKPKGTVLAMRKGARRA